MTEYRALLDKTFGRPKSFCGALKSNPGEALRYFACNTTRNLLRNVPKALLGHYRVQSEKAVHDWLYWSVRAVLLIGGMAGAARLYRTRSIWQGFFSKLPERLARRDSTTRALLLLFILLSTSLPAIVLLVGTPRYFLPWIPLFYLGVAYSVDSLLKTFALARFEGLFVVLILLCFCGPNFLVPRPNYEMGAVRHVARFVQECPRVAAGWAEPYVVLGLCGKGEPVSIWDGIKSADIQNGRIDILMIDSNFRFTQTWAAQRDFFESFAAQPETCGFKKLLGYPTGRFEVYYKPKRPLIPE